MDPNHRTFLKPLVISSAMLLEFFTESAAMQNFIAGLDVANSNDPVKAKALRQRAVQNALLDAAKAEEAAKNSWTPPTLPPTEWAPMAVQQQQGAGAVLPRDEAEAIRQDQYARQVAMLAAARLTP